MRYRLWVAATDGAPFIFEIDAPTLEAARAQEASSGHYVLGPATGIAVGRRAPMGRGSRFDLLQFTQQLLALLNAGLNVMEGLRALDGNAGSDSKRVMGAILTRLKEGQSLADALTGQPEFPELYVSLVRASEHTSDLPTALGRYIAYATQMNEVRQKITSAAVYPLLLVAAGGAAIVFLLTYVVPRFSGIYEGMHGELPWAATLMLRWGLAVKGHGTEMFLALIALGFVAVMAASSDAVRRTLTAQMFRLPMLGEEVRRYHISRLFRTVGMLLEGGITITRALRMASEILPVGLRPSGEAVLKALKEGQRPSLAFQSAGLSTLLADQMLAVGERSGGLGSMMTRIAQFYEGDSARKLERAMRVFEPILMAAIGLGIGLVVILMYLPIFELAGAVQ